MKHPEDSHGSPNGKKAEESCCSPSPVMGKVMERMMRRFCGDGKEELPRCCSLMEEMMGEMGGNSGADTSERNETQMKGNNNDHA